MSIKTEEANFVWFEYKEKFERNIERPYSSKYVANRIN